MKKRFFIRPTGGTWREITPVHIGFVDRSYGYEADDLRNARMAENFGITGDFEIETRAFQDGVWFQDSIYSGTTAILIDAPSYEEVMMARQIAKRTKERLIKERASLLLSVATVIVVLGIIILVLGQAFKEGPVAWFGGALGIVAVMLLLTTQAWKNQRLNQLK